MSTDSISADKQTSYGKVIKIIVFLITVSASIYHVYFGLTGVLEAFKMRGLHLAFLLPVSFLIYPLIKGKSSISTLIIDIMLFIVSFISILYLTVLDYERIINRMIYVDRLTSLDLLFGVILIVSILEATRRIVGNSMVIIAFIAIVYALFGNLLSGPFSHTGVSFERLIEQLAFTTEGIFGIPLAASATYIFLFVLFGVFLEKSGVGQFFIDFSYAAAGHYKGGPAKVSVIASALMGSIAGSSTANVTSTGAYTIPLMKRVGYKPAFAGGIEAAASTGGQILPPVMGAAAFILAEFVGIPFTSVIIAAVVPAILYFVGIWFSVHFQAVKMGLKGLPKEEMPKWRYVLKHIHLSLPIIVIVAALFYGYTPYLAALVAIASTIIVSLLRKSTRMSWRQIIMTLSAGAKSMIMIGVTCAAAGIIIGVFSLTGLGITFTSTVVGFAQGNLILVLIMVMLASIILGMGLPTSAAYIMVAAIAVPILVDLGINVLAAHLFALYFGVFSGITPPVAISSYAAAGIAGAKPMMTSLIAFKIAIPAFLIPYIFVFHNELLLQGEWLAIGVTIVTAVIGIMFLSVSLSGAFLKEINMIERLALLVVSISIISTNNFIILFCNAMIVAFITWRQVISMKNEAEQNNKGREEMIR
ncbi:TRAP transporter permease [Alkalihalobacillus oceani]|uniref:TRAP transporter permease n=1 Tax=Halalkalibacter oceani TaxID=1653776 RepID=UPI002041FA1A|nr:TRAP transporter permease [Halalkalibacter oceani]MCM3760332.1 TRAP transporter permease [Halalkalibacter oceani]